MIDKRKFVSDHITDSKKLLKRLEEVHFMLFSPKSIFNVQKVLLMGHICEPYRRKPSPSILIAILNMKEECVNVSRVRTKVFVHMCVLL